MLPAPEFVLFLPHENSSRRIGMHLVRAGHRRHIRPPAAYHAVPVAIGGLLGAFFAPALRLAARTPLFRRVCTELPRKSRHTASRQDRFAHADVGNDALLHLLPDSTNRNKDSIVPCRCGGDLAYTVIQDVEMMC